MCWAACLDKDEEAVESVEGENGTKEEPFILAQGSDSNPQLAGFTVRVSAVIGAPGTLK